jgi:hypothetical protein
LLENLLAVCDEQQPRVASELRPKTPVVQRGNDGLAGSGGGDDEVLPSPMPLTFSIQLLEDLGLMWPRLHVEHEQRGIQRVLSRLCDRAIEPRRIPRWCVVFVLRAGPVACEGRVELFQYLRRRYF